MKLATIRPTNRQTMRKRTTWGVYGFSGILRRIKALLVVGLLLGIGFPVNEATGQNRQPVGRLSGHTKALLRHFSHATVALGPANLVQTCTVLDALFKARKRKEATLKSVRSACPAGTIRTDDTGQWKKFLEVEKTRIEECKVKTTKPYCLGPKPCG